MAAFCWAHICWANGDGEEGLYEPDRENAETAARFKIGRPMDVEVCADVCEVAEFGSVALVCAKTRALRSLALELERRACVRKAASDDNADANAGLAVPLAVVE